MEGAPEAVKSNRKGGHLPYLSRKPVSGHQSCLPAGHQPPPRRQGEDRIGPLTHRVGGPVVSQEGTQLARTARRWRHIDSPPPCKFHLPTPQPRISTLLQAPWARVSNAQLGGSHEEQLREMHELARC